MNFNTAGAKIKIWRIAQRIALSTAQFSSSELRFFRLQTTQFTIGIAFFMFLMLASASFAIPDLKVLDLQYASNGRLVVNIFNQAPEKIESNITVKFYDNGREIGTVIYTDPLPRYSVFSAYVDYPLSKGLHAFRAVVDPDNLIAERNDDN
ncbi:MAG: CARDB domain-containing protein, partial [Candidatus Aenigmarchaeota archaeon]|nr:CARDB domain-containing protein [Candidatus Aenigmarchaeota archaeon]MDI6722445.1 CARDB domain-containing protein [Candidatus Aenigmarchaeota archaeon]